MLLLFVLLINICFGLIVGIFKSLLSANDDLDSKPVLFDTRLIIFGLITGGGGGGFLSLLLLSTNDDFDSKPVLFDTRLTIFGLITGGGGGFSSIIFFTTLILLLSFLFCFLESSSNLTCLIIGSFSFISDTSTNGDGVADNNAEYAIKRDGIQKNDSSVAFDLCAIEHANSPLLDIYLTPKPIVRPYCDNNKLIVNPNNLNNMITIII
ncbi:hypothetical protein DERP_000926 [Dermatophagoides pteronyssinus]|uniref:Uncharacterized protein n=1 Tax=Dermatophagoides pteronyssinus TaxID=6956 RepID=A0ABQ8JD09_DERPT|nr:hypothetical protein DERP_000926 [Dermatophagoides pteronyssinus]